MLIILCASQQTESAFSMPSIRLLVRVLNNAAPPQAASTCIQIPARFATSAIARNGSKAPRTVVPDVATTQKGCSPCLREASMASSRASGRMRPWPSVRTLMEFAMPMMVIVQAQE